MIPDDARSLKLFDFAAQEKRITEDFLWPALRDMGITNVEDYFVTFDVHTSVIGWGER